MICKECGAYNPDHANFCKVCAANLKGQDAPAPQEPETDAAPQEQEAVPAPSRMNRTARQKPAASAEPEAAPEETEEEAAAPAKTLEPEENTTRFSRKRYDVCIVFFQFRKYISNFLAKSARCPNGEKVRLRYPIWRCIFVGIINGLI